MRKARAVPLALGGVALTVTGLAAPAAPASAGGYRHGPVVVVTGLNNPRQLAWGRGGSLLVAEAGRGSPNGTNCFTGPEGTSCAGATGSISQVRAPWWTTRSRPHRIARGLLSAAAPDGGSAVGSAGVTVAGGTVLAQETYLPPDALTGLPAWQSGQLLARFGRGVRPVADIAAVERRRNPDHLQVDSNPYAVLSLGGHRTVTADAAGNDLVLADRGRARPFTVFPLHGCGGTRTPDCDQEPVPTSLARGPHGALYVGELAHFEPNEARVRRVDPRTGRLLGFYGRGGTICRSDRAGFTTVTGVAFGTDGSLYVSELAGGPNGQGQLVRIGPDCHRSTMPVPLPAGLAVDPLGNVYVSVYSISDRDGAAGLDPSGQTLPPGQVWRVRF